ncbi:hypothetical protein IFT84_17590 [Rhizobium sp. CFBP 8762]|uniref:hypothetical protein n=1 Tax=Rhizobium sp. CFBP 8762 TaxID=2775279 RepID=UPI00177B23C2|nr:hypothetical protein [Rhizobium sp. CFBP 8762]MBD8556324.1 hypothetical protein [Rhizobium sp. CFBP 8762]
MGFERAKIIVKAASVGTGLKVTVSKRGSNPATIRFVASKPVATSFGWSDGDKLEVLIGTEGDHGLIRLRKNNSIGDVPVQFKRTAKGEWVSLSLGHQPMFIDQAQEQAWCRFEQFEDGYVEIVLPRWADLTAPKKALVPPVVAKQTAPATTQRGTNVTASIMGDPPANRREMMAKVADLKI